MKQIIFAFIALCFVTVIGVASYAYFIYIPDKVEKTIIESFNNFGFEELKIGKLERKSGQIILSEIALDKDKFSTIDMVNIQFSLMNFLISPNSAQNIIVQGMNLTGDTKNNEIISISGWTNAQKILDNLQNFPAGTITFEKSQLDLLTNQFGGLGLKFDARINMQTSGEVKFKANLKTKQKKLGFISNIEGNISTDGGIAITSDVEDISVNIADTSVKRGLAKLEASYTPNNESSPFNIYGEIDIASLRWRDMPLKGIKGTVDISNNYKANINGSTFGTNPIKWKSSVEKKSNNIFSETIIEPNNIKEIFSFLKQNKNLSLSTEIPAIVANTSNPVITVRNNLITDPLKIVGDVIITTNDPKLTFKADYNNNNKNENISGTIKLDKTQIKLHKDGDVKEENSNPERPNKDNTRFDISAFGEFTIKELSSTPYLDWFIHTDILNGSLDYEVFELSKINGSIFIGGTKSKKKKTKPLKFSLPIKSSIPYAGIIRVNTNSQDRPILDKISLKIYGGKILTKYPILKNHSLAKKNSLTVSDINISDLLRDAGFKNIFMQGKLGGVVPFEVKEGKMKVNGAILQSQNSGILMLPDKIIAGLFPGNSRKMVKMRAALKNYHYEFFEIRFDGDMADRVMMTLNARGYNPDMKSKESVDLKLQIGTQISLLFKNMLK